ncbi:MULTISPECIES: hypothetical protein [unclassified Flavobacterium]|uniref:hypothetical protein n=1 Tax=unclassified Flavobacterium TaxID=196869 RepID=UPI001F133EA3|nr:MULTISPECIES: hypothetical protein [unclassified Flavobacterium]UMY64715.1 hypothetical protein MKO97_09335 [Flavobacterium sp. HJ-32-4]
METDHTHRFDGKEDKGYHQKPFEDNADPLPQIDPVSAGLAEESEGTKTSGESDKNEREKTPVATTPETTSPTESAPQPIDDSARLTQYPDGND